MAFRNTVLIGINESKLDENDFVQLDKYCPNRTFIAQDAANRQALFKEADCILGVLGLKFGASDFDAAPKLKYLGLLSTGYGGVDLKAAAERGIAVTNIPGYSTDSVAELTIGMLLEYYRDLEKAKVLARQSVYANAPLRARELKGKTFALLGLGQIGEATAKLAKAFGCHVAYWSRERKTNVEQHNAGINGGIEYRELGDLLKTADILSINLALNDKTEGFLSKAKIALLKKGAIIVSTAPLALTDIDALKKRVEQKEITLIFDHTDQLTPPQAAHFIKLENCVAYPHMGYNSDEARVVRQNIFFTNIQKFLDGKAQNNLAKK